MFKISLLSHVIKTQRVACASLATAVKKSNPLITCKNTKFNLMSEDIEKDYSKPGAEIELASKGWQHYKSKGDHFIIHPSRNVIDSNFKDSTDVDNFELNSQMIHNLKEKHDIHKATKLQTLAINKILKGEHVLIAAETGCGKVCISLSLPGEK